MSATNAEEITITRMRNDLTLVRLDSLLLMVATVVRERASDGLLVRYCRLSAAPASVILTKGIIERLKEKSCIVCMHGTNQYTGKSVGYCETLTKLYYSRVIEV